MITLDPDFVGSLAPQTKLTTAVNDTHDIPFSRLPRLERLRVQGKADETEVVDDDDDGDNGKTQSRAEREKRKMRGKGKSVKRYVLYLGHDKNLSLITSKTQIPPEAAQECHRSHCGEP
jgi:U3 small nucleolar RNA-associated protein 7